MKRSDRLIEAGIYAVGAGCAAIGLQPSDAKPWKQAVAFAAAALPVFGMHLRAEQHAAKAAVK